MKVVRSALLFVALLASGCAEQIVSARAQRDLGCSDVTVTEGGPGGEYEASGCGQTVDYACITSRDSTSCIREGSLEPPPAPVVVVAPPAATSDAKPFPLDAAQSTMRLAADVARDCDATPGPRGTGYADVTFESDGRVSSVVVSAPFQDTAVGACVADKFRRATIPTFSNGPKLARKSFEVPARS